MFISDTTLHSGLNVREIVIIEDTVFKVLTTPTLDLYEGSTSKIADATVTNAVTFLAGLVINEHCTSIQLHSGSIMAK